MTKYKLAFMRLEFVSSSHLHCLVDITLGSGTAELEREVSNSFSRIKSNFPESPGLKVIFSRVSDKKRLLGKTKSRNFSQDRRLHLLRGKATSDHIINSVKLSLLRHPVLGSSNCELRDTTLYNYTSPLPTHMFVVRTSHELMCDERKFFLSF